MESRSQYPQTRYYQTWYGLTATVTLKSEFIHETGFGIFVVPHPAAVNWLLRKGLPGADAIALSVKHELGHLQTLPLALAYASVLAALSGKGSPWIRIPAALISSQAVWEIMAELFTRASLGQFYQTRYAGIKRLPRILFWLLAGLMASGGAILLAIR